MKTTVWIVEGQSVATGGWFPLVGVPVSWHRDEARVHAEHQQEKLGFRTRVTKYAPKATHTDDPKP